MRRLLCRAFALVLVMFGAGACAVTVESTWKDNGMNMASFDLQCPPEGIQVVVLNRNDGLGCLGSKVGARGCGKQTQYECDNARSWHRSAEISSSVAK